MSHGEKRKLIKIFRGRIRIFYMSSKLGDLRAERSVAAEEENNQVGLCLSQSNNDVLVKYKGYLR